MAWFLNHYECARCDGTWTDQWSCMCDDECPHCGAANRAKRLGKEKPELDVQTSIEEMERHGRRILEIAGMAGT